MALHGVNMPLATVASEAIAARVWEKLGLSDEEISAFFTGPAHFPWHRMGNLNKWDGPVPKTWHEEQVKLQHRILERMHQLGMHPIAPAFAGFVPEGFQKQHPDVPVKRLTWGGFPHEYNAFVLAPNTPYFELIGKMFIQEWEKEFGKNEFYLSDSFNEMDVPVPKDDTVAKYKLLADYGSSIYQSIAAGNPDATWVTQGWTFGYQHKFWDPATLKAMLKNVPDEKMIIIDLANEFPKYVWHTEQTWKTQQGFHGKKWIYS
jgi:alpha-N-acetylglucosaminidase